MEPKTLINKNEFVVGAELDINDDWTKYRCFFGFILWADSSMFFRQWYNDNNSSIKLVGHSFSNGRLRCIDCRIMLPNSNHRKIIVDSVAFADITASGVTITSIEKGITTGNIMLQGLYL